MRKSIIVLILTLLIIVPGLSGCSKDNITGNADKVRISIVNEVSPASAADTHYKGEIDSKGVGVLDYTEVDPKEVTALYLSGPSNSDLAKLKYFVNLKYLRIDNLWGGKVVTYDLKPLKDLQLEGLSIEGFDKEAHLGIKSLKPLSDMTSLVILNLSYCQITDVQDLSELADLRLLSITDDDSIKIDDLSPLYNLKNLGITSDVFEASQEWKYGPYEFTPDNPMIGLILNNGNGYETAAEVMDKIGGQ